MSISPTAFIVGPPRSGTSITAKVTDRLPGVANWFEPYFVWDRYFRHAANDIRTAADATPQVTAQIRNAFEGFQRQRKAVCVVDKAPRNCFKLPFINEIFPQARYIFLARDGRETILSIYRMWQRQIGILSQDSRPGKLLDSVKLIWEVMNRQPHWRHRLQFLAFQIGPPRGWLRADFVQKTRWGGQPGWGPQFEGWQELFGNISVLEFCSHQWVHCIEQVLANRPVLPAENCISIRYEEFTQAPQDNFKRIADFLGVAYPKGFLDTIPVIRSDNTDKWRSTFTPQELGQIGPIIGDTLIRLGYEKDGHWYQAPDSA